MPFDADTILKVSQGLLTPVIGIATTYIAWQQYKTAETKLVLERYDKRHKVYVAVVELLTIATAKGTVKSEDITHFYRETADAEFLFRREVCVYIEQLAHEAVRLYSAHEQYRDFRQEQPIGYDHKRVVEEKRASFDWLSQQFVVAKEKFKPYLKLVD